MSRFFTVFNECLPLNDVRAPTIITAITWLVDSVARIGNKGNESLLEYISMGLLSQMTKTKMQNKKETLRVKQKLVISQ